MRAGRLAAAIALGLALAAPAWGRTLEARVVRVVDGDTLHVMANRKALTIRLVYIDAPEHDQPYGREARRSLSELVRLDRIRLETRGKDKYKRVLARVFRVNDGADVNLAQVARGYAWSITEGAEKTRFDQAQADARRARRGLWSEPRPISPRTWRRKQR